MKLSLLQDRFADALLDPDAPAGELIATITGPPRLNAQRRVDIYRANVIGALTRSLEAGYPVCRRIVGDKCFGALSRLYAVQHPSREHDLARYGETFPDFLSDWMAEQADWAEFGYLPDLARLEQLRHRAWRSEDTAPFDFDGFAAAADFPDSVHLLTPPSLGILESPYPVDRVWAINQDLDPPAEVAADGTCRLAVLRDHEVVVHQRIDRASFKILTALIDGATLSELMALDPSLEMENILPQLITRNFITGFQRQK